MKQNNWTPISLAELQELIHDGLSKMSLKNLQIWKQISITPEKWQEETLGQEGGGFWVVAIDEDEVIWYNDFEEGFNLSAFSIHGTIDEYWANEDELQWAMNKLKRHFDKN
ncbi:MAG: hypothetical protein AAF206_14665 [Bacteroidota bacterium]